MKAVIRGTTGRLDRFRPPRRATEVIERPFLTEKVRIGLEGQIVLVRAPSGYGKTELLSSLFQALRGDGEQVVWMTLSPPGATPFACELATASGFLELGSDPSVPLDVVLEALAAIPAQRVTVVLDAVEPHHDTWLSHLLDAIPDKLRLVVSARGVPDVPLSRFRMRGLLTEIDAADLAFSRSETRRVCGQIGPAEAEALQASTRGWPAFVRLAAARLALPLPPPAREKVLAGDDPDVRAFLREQVLPTLCDETMRLLSAAASMDEVHPVLACRLAGLEEMRAIERFEALAPLAFALPERSGWFALHPMLRAVIALDVPADAVRRHHSQAAMWFAASGQIEKAVHHAGKAGDFGFAADTIRAAGGVDLFLRAGYTVLRRLIDGLPPAVVHGSPGLRICAALVLAKEGQLLAAREALDELKSLTEDARAEIPDHVLVHIDCLFDAYEDRHFEAEHIEWLEARVRSYRLKDTWERGWLHNHLCIAHTRQGSLRQARLHALKALDCYREEGASYAQTFMLVHLALVNLLIGRLTAAATFSRQAEDLIQRTQWTDENLLAIARIPLAETLYRQGHVRAADAILAEALPIVSRGEGWVDVYARGFVTLARCRHRLLGVEAALAVAEDARDVAEDRGLPRLLLIADILRVETLTVARMLDAARDVAAGLPDLAGEARWPARRENRDARVAVARLTLRGGDPAGARDDLLDVVASAHDEDDAFTVLTSQILLSEAMLLSGDAQASLAHLGIAVELARPQDLVEPFALEGEPFRETVRGLVRRWGLQGFGGASAAFLNRVIATGEDGALRSHAGLLSRREADVLALLAHGLSNKEIARDLGITEATAKFHLKNLFAKLGASRRTMAVSIARAMGLVEGDGHLVQDG